MNDKCIHCGGDLQHTEGRRPKKFCSDTCRSSYWATEKRKRDPKYVRLDTYKDLEEKYERLQKVVEDLKGQVDFAHKPLIPNVPNEEAFVDPRLEVASTKAPVSQDILDLAKGAAPNTYDSPKKQYTTEDESPKYVAPPKQEPPTQAPILSYQELLRLAPNMDTREKREEFLKEVTRNRKLNANQKEAIHRKLPNLQ
jgi:hypothetical protein